MSPLDAKRPLVRLDCVTRRFGDLVAVDNVSFDIAENEFFALLGPSGCGKTTVLRILAGLDEPDDGTITLDGEDLMAMPVHRRPVNLMFQSYALFPHLTVAKNVAYGLERERRPRPEIRQRVADVLDVVGLGAVATRKPAQLSGGQRQRVALARAIVKRPKLLLLDEPLAALDRKIRGQMQTELKRLQHDVGITFVVVTHDQDEAMSMADRIAVMNAGRIEQLASPTVLYERPVSRFVADFIGSTNLLDGVVTSGGILLASGTCVAADVAGRNDRIARRGVIASGADPLRRGDGRVGSDQRRRNHRRRAVLRGHEPRPRRGRRVRASDRRHERRADTAPARRRRDVVVVGEGPRRR